MSVIGSLLKKFTIEARQQEAINKMKSKKSPNTRVFSFEDIHFKPGCRRFIAVELRDFYLWYRECASELKHFYEIILEDFPCRLYFDLEFPYDCNKEADGAALTIEFCKIVCSSLHSLLNIALDPNKNFLILDSSNASKFSAHVIVHVKEGEHEKLFPNNLAMKTIVMYICSNLLKSNCCILNGPKGPIFICDIGVYTRNRNFRIFQSSKCGKDTVLQLADYCRFYEENGQQLPKNAKIFLDSLVIPYGYDKLELVNLSSLPAVCALNATVEALRRKHSTGNEGGIEPFLNVENLDVENIGEEENDQNVQQPSTSYAMPKIPFRVNNIYFPSSSDKYYSKVVELAGGREGISSPFPFIDAYMLKIFRRFNSRSEIRMWRFICVYVNQSKDENTHNPSGRYYNIQYQLNNSRYCMSRGREHQKQNVYWGVDLTSFYFVQRCFDKIDCPNYVSPAFALPREICIRLHACIGPVFKKLGISTEDYTLPDLDSLLAKRYPAFSDSFNKSVEWSERYGSAINFLELHSTPSILKEREIAEQSIRQSEEEIDVVN
ncbi:hypothetical protein ACQ4LE_000567 [Meloidogyne hapla]|uniref:DNA-directed primase/polymerase protein n=1 Tax=Meloidogyne hapla TaxID=6305 RepID=A0A1I8BT33_MELHA